MKRKTKSKHLIGAIFEAVSRERRQSKSWSCASRARLAQANAFPLPSQDLRHRQRYSLFLHNCQLLQDRCNGRGAMRIQVPQIRSSQLQQGILANAARYVTWLIFSAGNALTQL